MAAPKENWVYDNKTTTEKDAKALEHVKAIERKNIKQGYRWIRISPITEIHVPCDKDGNPTEEGMRRIKLLKDAKGGLV